MHNLSVSYWNKTNKQSWIIESNISNHIVARYYVNYPPAKVCLYKCLLLRIADEAVTKKRMLQRGRHSGVSKHNPLIISALDHLLLYKALRKNGQHAKKKLVVGIFQSHLNPLHIYFDKVLLSSCRVSETDASWPCHLKRSLLCAASHSPLLLYNKNTVSSTCAASLYIKPLSEI